MLKEQNKLKLEPQHYETNQKFDSVKEVASEISENCEQESPTLYYTQRAQQIAKTRLKPTQKTLKSNIISISSPRSEPMLQGTPLNIQKASRNEPTHFAPQTDKKDNSESRSSSMTKDLTPNNLCLTIRLPHIKFQKPIMKSSMRPPNEKPAVVINPLCDKTCGDISAKPVKETTAITCNLNELCKIFKFRADDALILDSLINHNDETLKVPVHLVDDTILKVEYRENVRVALESDKLYTLTGLLLEDRECRKGIIRKIKKTICTVERKCFPKEESVDPPSIKDQVNDIMNPGVEQPVKGEISQDKAFTRILRYAFQEQKMDVAFIAHLCIYYTRLLLQKFQRKAVNVYNKAAAKSLHTKRIWTRQISTSALWINSVEMQRQYNKLCVDKVTDILMSNNKITLQEIKDYQEGYVQRHKKT